MKVRVRVFANLRLKMGKEEIVIDMGPVEECTVRDVLFKIAEITTWEISSLIISQDGEARSVVRVVREGKDLQFSGGLGTKVREGDCLSVFPLLAGG